ncbi:hypothetical protein Tco_0638505 [Tanacetum coccineum]
MIHEVCDAARKRLVLLSAPTCDKGSGRVQSGAARQPRPTTPEVSLWDEIVMRPLMEIAFTEHLGGSTREGGICSHSMTSSEERSAAIEAHVRTPRGHRNVMQSKQRWDKRPWFRTAEEGKCLLMRMHYTLDLLEGWLMNSKAQKETLANQWTTKDGTVFPYQQLCYYQVRVKYASCIFKDCFLDVGRDQKKWESEYLNLKLKWKGMSVGLLPRHDSWQCLRASKPQSIARRPLNLLLEMLD